MTDPPCGTIYNLTLSTDPQQKYILVADGTSSYGWKQSLRDLGRHLGVLEKAGLVEVRRQGRSSHYRVNRERLFRVVGRWLDNLQPPTPEQTWTSSAPKSTRPLAVQKGSKTTKSKSKGKHR